MNNNEIRDVLEQHKLWLNNKGGEEAYLQEADLQGADLQGADLQGASIDAKEECLKHLKRMYAEFSVQIGEILGGYDEN